jgi:hypothetical protein
MQTVAKTKAVPAKHSFVICNEYSSTMYADVLQPLGLKIIAAESDVPMGYFTVTGANKNITLLKQYLAGSYVL